MKLKVIILQDEEKIDNIPSGIGEYHKFLEEEFALWSDDRLLLEGDEICYYIEVEQMPAKDQCLFTYFGLCEAVYIWYDLTGNNAHEVYVKEI